MGAGTQFYVIVYVVAGLVFLCAAVYLQATRQLAVSNAPNQEALAVEYKDFKLRTFYPIVGLFVIAFACMIAFPIFFVIHPEIAAISVRAPVRPQHVAISTPQQSDSGDPTLVVYRADEPVQYVVQGDRDHAPVTLQLLFDGSEAQAEISSQIPPKTLKVKRTGARSAEIIEEIDLPLLPSATPPPNKLTAR